MTAYNSPPEAETESAFSFDPVGSSATIAQIKEEWDRSTPFRHVIIDDFLKPAHVLMLSETFPKPDHPVWLDWRKRSPAQYGKQGPGNSDKFSLIDWRFRLALLEFNSDRFLQFLEATTSITGLLPDPYFTGGGMHQILHGGILDIHTDFNHYPRLNLYRRLNALLYLTVAWEESYGGSLELWNDAPSRGGERFRSIPPLFNRMVIFETDKTSFHGHPDEWSAPPGIYRRSIALYYYTADRVPDRQYDEFTDFQGYAAKELPDA